MNGEVAVLAVAWPEMKRSSLLRPTPLFVTVNPPDGVPPIEHETEIVDAVLVSTQRTRIRPQFIPHSEPREMWKPGKLCPVHEAPLSSHALEKCADSRNGGG